MRCTVLAKCCVGVEDDQSMTENGPTAPVRSQLCHQAGCWSCHQAAFHLMDRRCVSNPDHCPSQRGCSVPAFQVTVHHCGEAEAGNWNSCLPPSQEQRENVCMAPSSSLSSKVQDPNPTYSLHFPAHTHGPL